MRMFARRAAPIQVNYLAYPFTCGVRTMDYRITDAVLDPPGSPGFGPESLIRMRHCFWLYRPNPAVAPPPSHLPAQTAERFTFASFNETRKLNAGVAAVWTRILNNCPSSRLLLLARDPVRQRDHIERLFSAAGLDPARIELLGYQAHHEHLNRYCSVDLCLDPFPYGGHTTTLDALWMGVPTITLRGNAPYSRAAASILSRVSLEELIADSADDYVAIATELFSDSERLSRLRSGLRERMASSVLCDELGFTREFERGLRIAWDGSCRGLSPAEIGIAEA